MDWIPVAVESTLTVFAIGFFWNSPEKTHLVVSIPQVELILHLPKFFSFLFLSST